jgi:hypothetical protein
MTVSDSIPLPFDEGQWIKVRALTGREYEEAQSSHRAGFVAGDKWAGFFRAVAGPGPESEDVQRILRDPLTGYDRSVLVRLGLTAWSYEAAIARKEPPPEEYDAIRDLSDDAIDFMAREVLRRTKPSLFVETAEQVKAAQVKS